MASCLAATSSAVGDRARQKLTISAHHRLSFAREWGEQRSSAAGLAVAVRRTGKHCRYGYGCFTLVVGAWSRKRLMEVVTPSQLC